jgi:Ca2+-binding EF-hand superfamily protein
VDDVAPEEEVEIDDNEEYMEEDETDTPTTDKAYQMLIDPAVNGITLESLLKVCAAQEDSWTEQQVLEMMNEADLNHDGMIDPNEFKILCKKAGFK